MSDTLSIKRLSYFHLTSPFLHQSTSVYNNDTISRDRLNIVRNIFATSARCSICHMCGGMPTVSP